MSVSQIRSKKSSLPGARDLGQYVAETLARDLFTGTYKAGDMLPTETELVERHEVSRASVRSGLQTLTALGMIRRQAGKGTVVEESREWNLLDPLVSRWMAEYGGAGSSFMKEIVDYRRAIEPYVSALAATRATAHDLAAIESAYDAMAAGVDQPTSNAFSMADIEFHAAIYRATHNLIWAQSASILRPAIHLVIEKSNSTAEELSDSLERHRRVLEAIRLRQPTEAFDAAIWVMDRTAHDLNVDVDSAENDLLDLMRSRSLPQQG
jgi:DNA-binding FadR family transcriptional regulator